MKSGTKQSRTYEPGVSCWTVYCVWPGDMDEALPMESAGGGPDGFCYLT